MDITIKEIKDKLQKSMMFTMSLSGKELFHSNFIVYLAQQHTSLFNEIMKDINGFFYDPNIQSVHREQSHTDIMFVGDKNKPTLIIENKFKSVPYKAQLRRYVEDVVKASEPKLLLLSLEIPESLGVEDSHIMIDYEHSWQVITYRDFIKRYDEKLPNYLKSYNNPDKEYINGALNDYSSFVKLLLEFIGSFNVNKESVIGKLPICPEEMDSNIRMHDITSKIRFSTLTSFVYNCLRKEIEYIDFEDEKYNNRGMNSEYDNYVFLRSSYEQAGPLMEAVVRINLQDNNYALYIVQIQNATYGRGILYFKNSSDFKKEHKNAWETICSDEKLKKIIGSNLILNKDLKNDENTWKNSHEGIIKPTCAKSNCPNRPTGKAKVNPYYHFNSFIIEKWEMDVNKTVKDLADSITKDIISVYKSAWPRE